MPRHSILERLRYDLDPHHPDRDRLVTTSTGQPADCSGWSIVVTTAQGTSFGSSFSILSVAGFASWQNFSLSFSTSFSIVA